NAFKVNALGTQNLAIVSNKIGCKLVHISTDYVFDGLRDIPYREMGIIL
ncbi:MAG: sugar nucleotide-binding protein, partial [Halanaerobiales bacterium]|nr:sugar nucleotide-binding protein [Halanaerobiales bacterium]